MGLDTKSSLSNTNELCLDVQKSSPGANNLSLDKGPVGHKSSSHSWASRGGINKMVEGKMGKTKKHVGGRYALGYWTNIGP